MAEWLALVGDEDALPGVAGIGAKGATTLLETYGSVAGAVAAIDQLKGRLGNALRAAGGQVAARARAGTARDRALAAGRLDGARRTPTRAPAVLNAVFDELGFAELLVADGASIRVEVCETAEAVRAALARLGDGPVAMHALVEDPAPVRGTLVGHRAGGVAAARHGTCPWRGARGRRSCRWLEDERAAKLGHDLVGTRVALRRAGIRTRAASSGTRRARRT